ncbi:Aste57867_19132 [Aphanomyces stellatus]|uniref:Aste57867_19132 protein n=1 Tax=Aphanomyces stellatus TaxID=120398 RepID=A0A485LDB2_9STRA|nr:hypothetical protein As57867_019068 [Aphanomyces stellatus]VFT95855.1 Aste57867_19132 [Aphanomyces stellatus]
MANNKQDKQTRRNEAKAKRRNKSANAASTSQLTSVLRNQAKQATAPGVAPPKLSAAKSLARQQMKQKQKELRSNLVNRNRMLTTSTAAKGLSLEALVGHAADASTSFADAEADKMAAAAEMEFVKTMDLNDNSRKAYMRELKKVVERADVILEILDARDPMGCRTMDMEDLMRSKGKKVVLVLNKIDLVPPEVLQPWLTYLRTFYPTIAFKASTQDQKNISSSGGGMGKGEKANGKMIAGSRAVGTEPLMQLLKNYCRSNNIKTAITVGVIGYPNVGKSSVINSLKRSKAASVSSTAGHTKVVQEIHLDNKIKLIDCPGIVFDTSDSNALILRNCVNAEAFNDPIPAIEVILSRCSAAQIQELYGVPAYTDTIEFLVHLALKQGKLGKGGIPDRKAVARNILQDWNRGKIPFFTPPPASKDTRLDDGATIVTSFADDFDLEKTLNPTEHMADDDDEDDDEAAQERMAATQAGPRMAVKAGGAAVTAAALATNVFAGLDSDDDDDDDDDDHSDSDVSMAATEHGGTRQAPKPKFKEDALNVPTALLARRKAKAMRKQKRKDKTKHMDGSLEDDFCDQLDNFDMSG